MSKKAGKAAKKEAKDTKTPPKTPPKAPLKILPKVEPKGEPKVETKAVSVYEDKVFEEVNSDLYSGLVPTAGTASKTKPFLAWDAGRFSWESYCKIYSFFFWAYKEHSGEAQCRVFYNKKEGMFNTFIPEQVVTSGSTDETDRKEDREALAKMVSEGWVQVMTLHSHPGFSASQSHTDVKDETDQPGLHLTLGDLKGSQISLHGRAIFRKYQYPTVDLTYWIATPNDVEGLPTKLRYEIAKYYFIHPELIEFPEAWKEKVIKKTYKTTKGTTGFSYGTGYGAYGGFGGNHENTGTTKISKSYGSFWKPLTSNDIDRIAEMLFDEFTYDEIMVAINNEIVDRLERDRVVDETAHEAGVYEQEGVSELAEQTLLAVEEAERLKENDEADQEELDLDSRMP